MRNDTEDADVPRRIGDRRGDAVSAAAASPAASASAAGRLPGWNDGPGRRDLPGPAASAAATPAGAPLGRTRISAKKKGGSEEPPFLFRS